MECLRAQSREYVLTQLFKQCNQKGSSICDIALIPKQSIDGQPGVLLGHSAVLAASLGPEFLDLRQHAAEPSTVGPLGLQKRDFVIVEAGFNYIYNFIYKGEFFNDDTDDLKPSIKLTKLCLNTMLKNKSAHKNLMNALKKEIFEKTIKKAKSKKENNFSEIVIETDGHPIKRALVSLEKMEDKVELVDDEDDYYDASQSFSQEDEDSAMNEDSSNFYTKENKPKGKRRRMPKMPKLEKPIKGSCCGIDFFKNFHLSVHLLKKHSTPMAICATCKEIFELEKLLQHFTECFIEQNDHPSLESALETAVECPVCKLNMQLQDFPKHLENQIKTVNESEAKAFHVMKTCISFKCKLCVEACNEDEGDRPSRVSSFVRLHAKRFHSINSCGNKREVCVQCGKMVYPRNLEKHMKTHTNPETEQTKPEYVDCDVCKKSIRRQRLTPHKRTHFEKYPCQHCKKVFNRRENRVVHERIHTGDKSFICDECGSSFRQFVQLRRHHKVHQKHRIEDEQSALSLTLAQETEITLETVQTELQST